MLRSINIANDKKRDASVGFESIKRGSRITMLTKDREKPATARVLKNSTDTDLDALLKKHATLEAVAEAIIAADPDVDIERTGMKIPYTNKVYVTKEGTVLYGVDLYELVFNPDGSEKERKFFSKNVSNVNTEVPIKCTGKLISKSDAVKKFVFSAKYQVKHINGLTYDFLFDIARQLHESGKMMFVGGGKAGNEPLVFQEGGTPYRGFLEGRIDGDKYLLILHLTNLELKELSR